MIVGTAGHVDHGKTTLVRALTGVDTGRPIPTLSGKDSFSFMFLSPLGERLGEGVLEREKRFDINRLWWPHSPLT